MERRDLSGKSKKEAHHLRDRPIKPHPEVRSDDSG
jgi:hypothetical protein